MNNALPTTSQKFSRLLTIKQCLMSGKKYAITLKPSRTAPRVSRSRATTQRRRAVVLGPNRIRKSDK